MSDTPPLPADLGAPLTDEELAAQEHAFEGQIATEDHPHPAPWRIEDDGAAEWAMRRLAAAVAVAEEAEAKHEAWVDELNVWLDEAKGGPNRDLHFFTAQLEDYAARQREAGVHPVKLPSGRVVSRRGQMVLEVTDERAFIDWALSSDRRGLVRTTETVDRPALRAVVVGKDGMAVIAETGEVVPGLRTADPEVGYMVKPG